MQKLKIHKQGTGMYQKRLQLRGESLRVHLRTALEEEALKAIMGGQIYVYNASAFSRATGVSRETLRKHQDFIDEVLTNYSAKRRKSDGNVTIKMLRERLVRTEEERDEAIANYVTLRDYHMRAFKILYMNSVDVSVLERALPQKDIDKIRECLFCGSSIQESIPKRMQKIISFRKKKP